MTPDINADERIQRSCEVVRDCIRRRAEGHLVSDQDLIDSHPELMPELGEHLAGLRVIESAKRQRDSDKLSTRSGVCVRCPHCHRPFSLAEDQQLSHVVCSACGSSFGLVDDMATVQQVRHNLIGHFQLVDCLGSGAFGTVFRALDTKLDRQVAVKIPRNRQFNEKDAESFIREARTAARLSHPNIVQIFEVGRDEEDLYIVADYVEGPDLAEWMTDQQATPHEVTHLCVKLADALDHAHQQGVIHRDLKPSNILIDDAGQPHLTDFGLAKRREAGDVTMTLEGKLLGTPAYMSPEQARGSAHEADERSDIYSLGVIIYEMLTGERPFRGSTRMLLHQILVEDAAAPRRLNSSIPKDLETICLKCLEKSPDRRYQSARELADELRRFLTGEPIRARPVSAAARVGRWAMRNPWFAALAAATAGLLLAVSIAGPWVAIHQTKQAEHFRWRSYVADMHLAYQRWESADMQQFADLLERYEPRDGQKDLRGFEWFYLKRLAQPIVPTRMISYDAPGHIAFSPDRKTLAITGPRELMLWDLKNSEPIVKRAEHHSLIKPVAFSPDGQLLATGGWDGELRLWPVAHDQGRLRLNKSILLNAQENMTYDCLAFSPDGKYLATSGGQTVPVWDLAQRRVEELKGHMGRVACVAFSPDGTLASGGAYPDMSIRLWDVETGEQITKLGEDKDQHTGGVVTIAFSPDGELLASGSHDDTVKLWQVSTGTLLANLEGHSNEVVSVAFSPDGKMLASASEDGVVNVWNPKRALELGDDEPIALKGHAGNVLYVAFSPSGKVLASSGTAGKQIRLWDLSTLPRPVHFEGCDVPWYSRGEALRSWTQDGLPQLCTNSNRSLDRPEQREGTSCMVRSQDGRLLATGHEDGTVELQMLDSGKTRRLRERHDGPVVNLLFSPNAKSMVSVEPAHPLRNVLKLWDVAAGNVLRTLNVSRWADPVFSEDLEVWAMVNEDPVTGVHSIKLWRADTGEELKTITEGQAYPYFSLEFSAHGQMLAAGDVWGEITVWDVNSGKHHLKPFQAHTSNVVGLAFSPDGTRLASGSYDRTVKLWDMATGDEMLTLRGHRRGLLSVGFSPDGSSLATASADGVVKLWRAATE